MKYHSIQKTLKLLLISLFLIGCTTLPINEEISLTTSDPSIVTRFTIQADEDLQAPITFLYEAYFQNEVPVFVDSDADLLATVSEESFNQRPIVHATFMPDSVLIPLTDLSPVNDFVSFSISPDGQQILIDAGVLPSSVTLTDQAGNTVEIAQPVRRVISAYGPSTALIYNVGAWDRLVAASYLGARDPIGASVMEKIDARFPEIMGDDFFNQQDLNIEEAAKLDPDLIVTSARTAWLDTAEQLDIPVFLFDAETPHLLREAVLLTGELFGPHATAQARAWVAYYDEIYNTVQEQTANIPNDERVRVLFTGTNPLRVASGDMYQTDIIEAAGGVSVTLDLGGYWNDINLEQVVIWDPDVIIVPPYGGASVEAITESSEWQILDAVQAGHVYRMPKLVVPWDTPAPDSVLGIVWMAQRLNPDYVDLSCAEEAEYFYNTFYNYSITAEEIADICTFD